MTAQSPVAGSPAKAPVPLSASAARPSCSDVRLRFVAWRPAVPGQAGPAVGLRAAAALCFVGLTATRAGDAFLFWAGLLRAEYLSGV